MTLKLIGQPNNKTCGQTSVAMVAGISVEESIRLFGHNKFSRTQMYRDVLDKLGIKYGEYTKIDARKGIKLPRLCLVRMQKIGCRTGHLIAYKDGVFYDPSPVGEGRIYHGIDEMMNSSMYNKWRKRWRFDYYMEILGDGESVIGKDYPLQAVAGNNKKYKVRVSHDLYNTGTLHYIERTITQEELENLKKATQFKIESCVVVEA